MLKFALKTINLDFILFPFSLRPKSIISKSPINFKKKLVCCLSVAKKASLKKIMTSTNERVSISSMASGGEDSNTFTCADLLTALGDQLQAQMDINSDYMLFQRKIERQQIHATKLLKNVSKDSEAVEKKWNDFIDESLGVKEQLVKEVSKNAKFSHGKSVEANKIVNASEIRQKHEDFLERVEKIKELTESTETYHPKTQTDQRRLSQIQMKNKTVQKLVKNIAIILKRENENAEKIKVASKNEERMYGVWELTSGYKQLLRHLGITLETLGALEGQSDKIKTPIPTLVTEELEVLINMLKRLDEKITAEISINKSNENQN